MVFGVELFPVKSVRRSRLNRTLITPLYILWVARGQRGGTVVVHVRYMTFSEAADAGSSWYGQESAV